ncbi:MAG: hypothetical protein A2W00_05715 [Candidatus Eisenbacteria bacterium RBG_16_71_46]|nr:MAG: hypothetical protein A2W00_05715 [Candidatus Eisenbacteria bacterium RBG_16_71_46]
MGFSMRAVRVETTVRRDQIARAALALIASRGTHALSVAAVARRVGLVPSAIYRHFRSKDEVLDAAIAHVGDLLLGNVAAARAATGVPIERLHVLLGRHLSMIREHGAIPRLIFSDDVYGGHAARKASMLRALRAYLDQVAEIAREGQEQGSVRADLEPDTVALLFMGLVQPAAVLWHLSDGRFDVSTHAERGWRLLSETLAPRDAGPASAAAPTAAEIPRLIRIPEDRT